MGKDNEMRSLLKTKKVDACLIAQSFTGQTVPATGHLEEQQLEEFSRIILGRQLPLQCNNGITHSSSNKKENAVTVI